VPSPEYPGKSIRSTPGSPFLAARMTVAGCPPRPSVHRIIFSLSVVTFAPARPGAVLAPFLALAGRLACRRAESLIVRPTRRGLTDRARPAGLTPRLLLVVDLDLFCIIADPTCAPASAFPIWVYPYPTLRSPRSGHPAARPWKAIAANGPTTPRTNRINGLTVQRFTPSSPTPPGWPRRLPCATNHPSHPSSPRLEIARPPVPRSPPERRIFREERRPGQT